MVIKLLFRHKPLPTTRAFVCILLSIALMIGDQRVAFFRPLHADLSLLVLPLQRTVDFPFRFASWLSQHLTTERTLLDQNEALRAEELLLQSRLQQLAALEQENSQLHQLLKSATHLGGRVMVGQLLAVSLDPNTQQVIIDKGAGDDLYVGQPVLDEFGIVGQVIHVGSITSKVMLVTDGKSAIPVENARTGVRAIAVGDGGNGLLQLINLPDTNEVKLGDMFVSSALGLHYPVGYPVGIVARLIPNPGQRSITILLQPAAHLDRSQQVLLAWVSKAALAKAVEQELNATATPNTPDNGAPDNAAAPS